MKFKLEIELGSEGMESYYDVAQALHYIAKDIHFCPQDPTIPISSFQKVSIEDDDGEVVGAWEFL